jgi:hypothetical protein
MRYFYFFALFCFWTNNFRAYSQNADTLKWQRNGAVTFNFSNVGLSNWAAGGQNSISVGGLIDLKATRSTNKTMWQSAFNLALGAAQIGKASENLFKKTDDQLIASTLYTRKLNKNWSLGTGLELRTQVLGGYLFFKDSTGKERRGQLVSNFMAPGYINTNVFGLVYADKNTTATFSPTFGKLTTVFNDSLSNAGAFGVDKGKRIRPELGLNFNLKLDYNLAENVNFKTNLNLFSAYDPYFIKRIDVNWETLFTLKVNKYITTTFGTQLIYDQDVLIKQENGTDKLATQFKHVLNVNFSYKFERASATPL